jgi:hypothetical protein
MPIASQTRIKKKLLVGNITSVSGFNSMEKAEVRHKFTPEVPLQHRERGSFPNYEQYTVSRSDLCQKQLLNAITELRVEINSSSLSCLLMICDWLYVPVGIQKLIIPD